MYVQDAHSQLFYPTFQQDRNENRKARRSENCTLLLPAGQSSQQLQVLGTAFGKSDRAPQLAKFTGVLRASPNASRAKAQIVVGN